MSFIDLSLVLDLLQDLIYTLLLTLYILFANGKETIEGSGGDNPDTGNISEGASAGPGAGPSRSGGRSFWEVLGSNPEGETSNPPFEVKDENSSGEGSSNLDKGKRKATEQEVLEQKEHELGPEVKKELADEQVLADEQMARVLQEEYDQEYRIYLNQQNEFKEESTEEVYSNYEESTSEYSSIKDSDEGDRLKKKLEIKNIIEPTLPRLSQNLDSEEVLLKQEENRDLPCQEKLAKESPKSPNLTDIPEKLAKESPKSPNLTDIPEVPRDSSYSTLSTNIHTDDEESVKEKKRARDDLVEECERTRDDWDKTNARKKRK